MSSDDDSETGDTAQKSERTILEQEIEEGLEELRRPTTDVALSGLSAGLDIGYGPLLMVVMIASAGAETSPLTARLFVSAAYSVGFLFVILGRSELFTEHTVLSLLPVLDRRAAPVDLAELWSGIYVGNLVGCTVFAGIAVVVAPAIDVAGPSAFAAVATHLTEYSWWATFASAVLAGWLMGLLSWLVVAARETTSIILVIVLVTGAIGFLRLPHCIAGSVEVLLGVFGTATLTVRDYAGFLLWSTLGNVAGGVVFVALLKYAHATREDDRAWDGAPGERR